MLAATATLDDLLALAELELRVFGDESYPRFFLRQSLALWPEWVWVARTEASQPPVGYVLGAASSTPGEGWVLSAGTLPDARGQGVGALLLGELVGAMATAGIRVVRLTVHPENTGACRLYERHGFRVEREEADYFWPGETCLLMSRLLNAGDAVPKRAD